MFRWLHNRAEADAHFLAFLVLAALCHLAIALGFSLISSQRVLSVPVRVLSIRLGGDEDGQGAPRAENKMSLPAENKIQQILSESGTKTSSVSNSKNTALARADTEYVREDKEVKGSKLGNSTGNDAAAISKYEQLISLWIEKHKVYPPEAKKKNLSGEAVIRLRIDRSGNIVLYSIEKGTGKKLLDQAITEMVESSNPVPPVPDSYPSGELIEFLVPISFKAHKK